MGNHVECWSHLIQINLSSDDDGVDELLSKFHEEPNKSVARSDLKGVLGELVKLNRQTRFEFPNYLTTCEIVIPVKLFTGTFFASPSPAPTRLWCTFASSAVAVAAAVASRRVASPRAATSPAWASSCRRTWGDTWRRTTPAAAPPPAWTSAASGGTAASSWRSRTSERGDSFYTRRPERGR